MQRSQGGQVKRRRLHVQLSERQQLLIGLVLVILVAISLLYCLGFASLALRQAWENSPVQINGGGTYYLEEEFDLMLSPAAEPTVSGGTPY